MALELIYTARKVDRLEKDCNNVSIQQLVANETIGNLFKLIDAGTESMNKDAIFDLIDKYRAEEKSTMRLQIEIIRALEDQGFLERELGMSEKIEARIVKIAATKDLENIGQPSSQ